MGLEYRDPLLAYKEPPLCNHHQRPLSFTSLSKYHPLLCCCSGSHAITAVLAQKSTNDDLMVYQLVYSFTHVFGTPSRVNITQETLFCVSPVFLLV